MYFSFPYLVTYQIMVFKTTAIVTMPAMLIMSYKSSYLGKWF